MARYIISKQKSPLAKLRKALIAETDGGCNGKLCRMKSSNSRRSRHDLKTQPVIHGTRGMIFSGLSTRKKELRIKRNE